jgi:hypothetical protein
MNPIGAGIDPNHPSQQLLLFTFRDHLQDITTLSTAILFLADIAEVVIGRGIVNGIIVLGSLCLAIEDSPDSSFPQPGAATLFDHVFLEVWGDEGYIRNYLGLDLVFFLAKQLVAARYHIRAKASPIFSPRLSHPHNNSLYGRQLAA